MHYRTQEGWILHVYKPGDMVELTSIDIHFPLAALYDLTDVPENCGDHQGPSVTMLR